MKGLSACCAAAAVAVSAGPGSAQHYSNPAICEQWRHGNCVSWHRMAHHEEREGRFAVGYNFGPDYSYIGVGALPQPVVTRYRLGSNFRYVSENGQVYVVSPRTYRVVRVISAH